MGREGTFERMARIALNGRLLVPGKLEGIGVFTWKCLQELVRLRPHDEFLLVVDRPHDEMFELGPNVEVRRMPVPGRRPWLLKLWFGWPLCALLRQVGRRCLCLARGTVGPGHAQPSSRS